MYNTDSIWNVNTAGQADLKTLRSAPGEHKKFTSGQTVIKEGDRADSMFFVLDGKVQIIVNYRTMDERYVATLQSGDLFGEMALFLKEPRTATVVALGDVTVVEIHRNTVLEFMKLNPENTYVIVELLCMRLRNVLSSLADY